MPNVPFDFSVRVAIQSPDGRFRGRIRVPSEAPAGDYALDLICLVQDQAVPGPRIPFRIEGTPATATTSTVETAATTVPARPPIPPPTRPADPAQAVAASATFTG